MADKVLQILRNEIPFETREMALNDIQTQSSERTDGEIWATSYLNAEGKVQTILSLKRTNGVTVQEDSGVTIFDIESINDTINTLDSTVGSTTIENEKHVAVEVTEADGVLTNLTVTEDNIANESDVEEMGMVVSAALNDLESRKANVQDLNNLSVQTLRDIRDAVNSLDSNVGSTTVESGKHIAVKVTEEDGILTNLIVTEDDIASASSVEEIERIAASALNDLEERKANAEDLDAFINQVTVGHGLETSTSQQTVNIDLKLKTNGGLGTDQNGLYVDIINCGSYV